MPPHTFKFVNKLISKADQIWRHSKSSQSKYDKNPNTAGHSGPHPILPCLTPVPCCSRAVVPHYGKNRSPQSWSYNVHSCPRSRSSQSREELCNREEKSLSAECTFLSWFGNITHFHTQKWPGKDINSRQTYTLFT